MNNRLGESYCWDALNLLNQVVDVILGLFAIKEMICSIGITTTEESNNKCT